MASLDQYRAFLVDELNSTALYTALSELEKDPKLAELYRRLAATEKGHAESWADKIRAEGGTVPPFRPSWRTRALIWIAKRFGIQSILPSLSAMEDNGTADYGKVQGSEKLAATERSHATLLRQLSATQKGGIEGGALAQLEGRHRTAGGNALRAAVLGSNDGLVSNLSLVMGVAGAELNNGAILVTGFAGLLAGAISMALGEWISVQSSRGSYEKQLRTEKQEIETNPEEEIEELTLIYQARGLDQPAARQLATSLMSNRETAMDTLARDELGINPEELGGSAWEAAITSFILFAVGAIVPVIPFLFLTGVVAIIVSGIFSAVGLFLIGTVITLFTGRSVLSSGMRMVVFGLAAALVTYLIGRVVGANIGG